MRSRETGDGSEEKLERQLWGWGGDFLGEFPEASCLADESALFHAGKMGGGGAGRFGVETLAGDGAGLAAATAQVGDDFVVGG